MQINIIGSGSIGSKHMSASTLIDNHILVDTPNGLVKYIKNFGFDILKIDTILITHLHGDHFFELPFFMLEKYFNKDVHKVNIICPIGTKKKVEQLFEIGFPGDYEKVKEIINVNFIELGREAYIKVDKVDVESKIVEHGELKPAFGYIIHSNNKKVGFSGDSIYCKAIDEIVRKSDISILDMSLKEDGNNAHMGFNDIKYLCEKYPNKKIIATHMHDSTREKALKNVINNLIIPETNFKIII